MTPAVTPNRGGPTEQAPKERIPELRNSNVSEFLQKLRKYKRLLEDFFCRSWGTYATLHRRISHYLSLGSVFFLELQIFLLILCADFQLGAQWLPVGGLRLPGSGLKGRLVSLGFDLVL